MHQSVTSAPAVLFHCIYKVTIWDVKNKIDSVVLDIVDLILTGQERGKADKPGDNKI